MNKSIKLAIALLISASVFTACGKQEDEKESTQETTTQSEVSELHLSSTELTMKINDTKTLRVKVTPSSVDASGLQWKSSDENIVCVDKQGKVSAVAEGTAVITVQLDGIKAACTIVVEPAAPELTWVVEPQYDYQNVAALMDIFPQNMGDTYKQQNGNYEGRVFYYVNDQAGMADYNGQSIVDSTVQLHLDPRQGISSVNRCYNANGQDYKELGGGGGYSFLWNEETLTILYSETEITENESWNSDYMTAMESVNIAKSYLGRMDAYQNLIHNNTYRLIGKSGQLVSQESFEDIKTDESMHKNIVGDYAVVKKNGLWGYMKEDGTWLIPCIYEDAYPFHNGIAAVKKDGKAGFIREDGSEVFDFMFQETRSVYQGKAWVKQDGKWGVLDIAKLAGIAVESDDTAVKMQEAAVSLLSQEGMLSEYISVLTFFDYDMDGKLELYFCKEIAGDGSVYGDIYSYEDGSYSSFEEFSFDKSGDEFYTVYKNEAQKYLFIEKDIITTAQERETMISKYDPQTKSRERIARQVEALDGTITCYSADNTVITESEYNRLMESAVQGYSKTDISYKQVSVRKNDDVAAKVSEAWNGYTIK